jgi:hypothetical protein
MTEISQIQPDFAAANADMDELIRLSAICRFDLFVFLRLLSEAGAPILCCEVDPEFAIPADRRIARYKLSEALRMILSALRAQKKVSSDSTTLF